jgi:hypothetical protein
MFQQLQRAGEILVKTNEIDHGEPAMVEVGSVVVATRRRRAIWTRQKYGQARWENGGQNSKALNQKMVESRKNGRF